MIDFLEGIDTSLTLFVNSHHNSFFDDFMWVVSSKKVWIPFYILLLYLVFKNFSGKTFLLFIGGVLLTVAFSDLIASHFFKEFFLRYRPSHNLDLQSQLHLYTMPNGEIYRGGQYGFISSHASNFFGIATFSYLIFKTIYKRSFLLLYSIAILVAFSRVYLGVHYVSDVAVGALVGIFVAFLLFKFVFLPLQIRFSYK